MVNVTKSAVYFTEIFIICAVTWTYFQFLFLQYPSDNLQRKELFCKFLKTLRKICTKKFFSSKHRSAILFHKELHHRYKEFNNFVKRCNFIWLSLAVWLFHFALTYFALAMEWMWEKFLVSGKRFDFSRY